MLRDLYDNHSKNGGQIPYMPTSTASNGVESWQVGNIDCYFLTLDRNHLITRDIQLFELHMHHLQQTWYAEHSRWRNQVFSQNSKHLIL